MTVDIKEAIGPLTGELVPASARAVLPHQYSKFNILGEYSDQIWDIRDKAKLKDSSEAAWLGFCMHLDRLEQQDLYKLVKGHPGIDRDNYWTMLKDLGTFPVYKAKQAQLTQERFSSQTVSTWINLDGRKVKLGGKIIPSSLHKAAKIYPCIYDHDLVADSFRWGKSTEITNRLFLEEVKEHAGEDVQSFVVALQLVTSARRLAVNRILEKIRLMESANRGEINYSVPDKADAMDRLLRRTEPYRFFSGVLDSKVRIKSTELYKDNAELARLLWSAVAHLRYPVYTGETVYISETKQNLGVRTSIRKPLVLSLSQGKFGEACEGVLSTMDKYPGILPDFVAEELKQK